MKTLDSAGCDGLSESVLTRITFCCELEQLLEPLPYSRYVWKLSIDIGLLEVYQTNKKSCHTNSRFVWKLSIDGKLLEVY